MTWICIRTLARRERQIADRLRDMGVTAYAPTEVVKVEVRNRHVRRHVPRTRSLLPSYCFVDLTSADDINAIFSIRPKPVIMANAFGQPKRVDVAKLRGLFLAEAFKCFDASWEPPKQKGYSRRFKKGDHVKHEYAGWLGVVLQNRRDQCIEVMFRAFGREIPFVVKEDAVIAEKDDTIGSAKGKEELEAA